MATSVCSVAENSTISQILSDISELIQEKDLSNVKFAPRLYQEKEIWICIE